MKKNIHHIERPIRVLVGLGLLSLVWIGPQTMWGLIGLIPIVTGLIGVCPAYSLLGISTCPAKTA